jgi:hypothetical protein
MLLEFYNFLIILLDRQDVGIPTTHFFQVLFFFKFINIIYSNAYLLIISIIFLTEQRNPRSVTFNTWSLIFDFPFTFPHHYIEELINVIKV